MIGEPSPCRRAESKQRALTVFCVAYEHTAIVVGYLDAVTAIVRAVAGLPPVHDVDHCSFATFVISSSEASRGSA